MLLAAGQLGVGKVRFRRQLVGQMLSGARALDLPHLVRSAAFSGAGVNPRAAAHDRNQGPEPSAAHLAVVGPRRAVDRPPSPLSLPTLHHPLDGALRRRAEIIRPSRPAECLPFRVNIST